MSTVPPAPHPQSAISATTPKKVGTAGYWIALAVFLLGCGAALVWFVIAIVGAVNAPNDFARTAIPGAMSVEIGTGEWVLYHEGPNINSLGTFERDPSIDVYDPTGDLVILDYDTNISSNYDIGGHEGRSFARFDADVAGVYDIEVFGEPSSSSTAVAIGRPLFEGAIVGIVGSIVLGAVCFLIALTLLIVTLVRRGKAKKAQATAPYQPVPAAPGAPGSFAAPIPTAPFTPHAPPVPGAPPIPGHHAAPLVAPPPGPAPASGALYTPGWAAPTDSSPPAAPVPPPPAPSGFSVPGGATPPPADPGPWPPAPSGDVGDGPASPVAEPTGPVAPAAPAVEPAEGESNDTWDKPGSF